MRIVREVSEGINFIELLLDERLCAGSVAIPKELVQKAGGVNQKLPAKQKYELILRIAHITEIEFIECPDRSVSEDYIKLSDMEGEQDGWRTDCYIAGRYSAELKAAGCFEIVLQVLLDEAVVQGRREMTLQVLEQMVGKKEAYYQIDDMIRPILIYKGDSSCYNMLNVFAEQFGNALERIGERVEYFDTGREDWTEIVRYKGKHYRAIIGVQTYLFTVMMEDGVHYLHEHIYGPKFNFIFDHPVWMKDHLQHQIPDFTVLTLDVNYVKFIEKYYHKPAILFPPAGMKPDMGNGGGNVCAAYEDKIYDLSFVGTYGYYMEQVKEIHRMERGKRFLANRLLFVLRKKPDTTLEDGLLQVLHAVGVQLDDEEFLELLYELRKVSYCVSSYYRDQVLRRILESGIRLEVFGDEWERCPLCSYPNLICHPNVTPEESLAVYERSRLSLNIMSWHKGGFTERMAAIMLSGAVLVTDDSTYLHGRYGDKDMLVFHLENLEELPGRIREMLQNDELREQVGRNGKEIAEREQTWDKRAVSFREILSHR